MSSTRTDWEIGATKAYNGCPKRFVIATGPEVFWTPESDSGSTLDVWDLSRIREVMEWTDFFQSRGTWDRLIVFCTEYPVQALQTPFFQTAWNIWAGHVDHLTPWELYLWFTGPSASRPPHRVGRFAATRPGGLLDLSGRAKFYPAEFGGGDEFLTWQEAITDYFGSTHTDWNEGESLADLFKRGATTIRYEPGYPPGPDDVQEVIILEPEPDGSLTANAFKLPYEQYTSEELAKLGPK